MNKEEFLQLVRLDDSITKLNLKVLYDGVDTTGEIKFLYQDSQTITVSFS